MDYLRASMMDVIRRSAVLHPSLYVEVLDKVAKRHRDYAGQVRALAPTVSAAAMKMADDAADVALLVELESMPKRLTLSARVIAFHEAAKLQCLSPEIVRDIARREQVYEAA